MAPHGDHGSGHSCESEHGEHNPDDPQQMGIMYSLYQKIDRENMECLNESTLGAGKLVFKPWEQRLTLGEYVDSEDDGELLFNIPFTGNVRLKGFIIISANVDYQATKVRLFKNRPHMAISDVESEADQEFQLVRDTNGTTQYATKVARFGSVHHLSMHFPSRDDVTRIHYIGLSGEFSIAKRHGVTICNYELAPSMTDHKNAIDDHVSHRIQ